MFIVLCSIEVLTQNGQFFMCATTAFGEQYDIRTHEITVAACCMYAYNSLTVSSDWCLEIGHRNFLACRLTLVK